MFGEHEVVWLSSTDASQPAPGGASNLHPMKVSRNLYEDELLSE